MLLNWLIAHGARQAEPGEFTARAYFHGKLDLSQAEGSPPPYPPKTISNSSPRGG